MNKKIYILLLFLSSFLGYLEWGKDRHSFLFQMELEIISKGISDPLSVAHPFTILPLTGQVLLFISLFRADPNKIIVISGTAGLAILFLLIFTIGMLGRNFPVLLSSLPFLILSSVLLYKIFKKSIQYENSYHRNRRSR